MSSFQRKRASLPSSTLDNLVGHGARVLWTAPLLVFALACGATPTGSGGAGGNGGTGGTAGAGGTGGVAGYGSARPGDCVGNYSVRAHGGTGEQDTTPFPVPLASSNEGNQYMCFYFNPPYSGGAQGLWFASDFSQSDTRFIHHWLLYGTENPSHQAGTSGPCSAAEPGSYLIAGWAPGAKDTALPPDVGLLMPPPGTGQLILEVHYANPTGITGAVDSTAVQFCTAPEGTRAHTASVQFTGSEGICIPPQASQEVQGPCKPREDMGDIHVVGWWPHMHKIGTRMVTTITRAAGNVETMHDAPFSFSYQIPYYPPNGEIVIHPGDKIETDCYYANPNTTSVHFGERTQDEMCYNFVTAWPAHSLSIDPTTLSALETAGLSLQQDRRCVQPLSIFSSCNGLSDYPQAVIHQ